MKLYEKWKLILLYLALLAGGAVMLDLWGNRIVYREVLEQEEDHLYLEAKRICGDYVPDVDVWETRRSELTEQFRSLEELTQMRIWLVSPDGKVVLDSREDGNCEGQDINRSDSQFLSHQSVVGKRPQGLVGKPTVSVIYPVTEWLETRGYVVVMEEESQLWERVRSIIGAVMLCYLVMLSLMGILVTVLYLRWISRVKRLTYMAREYAEGHTVREQLKLFGEQRELAEAVEYLAGKVQTSTEYQRKFIANVSHDFRSPLTSIKGYAEAMADGTIPVEQQGKYLQTILFEVERLTKLTGDLLTLNQLDHQGITLSWEQFDINDVIKKAAVSMEQRCTRKKISLELIFEDPVCMVWGDQGKIQQVLQNILDNAVKFSHSDSVVEVHTARRRHKVFVSVKDYGIGIPRESVSKIWNRFYKTDLSRGKDKTGTGLGLSITREIIDAHGEHINVVSTEGAGTEFIFSLPTERE